jgi:Protein of unknown function (DUF3631)
MGALIAVADLAGGAWPDAARKAATHFVISAKTDQPLSLGTQLLADIRTCFGDNDRMATAELLDMLIADPEAPWGDLKGKKIDARKLAGMLREYGIRSSTIRMPDGSTLRAYKREAFLDAWKRYLPGSPGSATSATSATDNKIPNENNAKDVAAAVSPPPSCGGSGGSDADGGA